MSLIYVVVVSEPEVEPYVILDAAYDMERARQIMMHRAEELVDDLTTESEGDIGYEIQYGEECTAKILVAGTNTVCATMTVQPISPVDSAP